MTTLTCHTCYRTEAFESPEEARKKGWVHGMSETYCPSCWMEMGILYPKTLIHTYNP